MENHLYLFICVLCTTSRITGEEPLTSSSPIENEKSTLTQVQNDISDQTSNSPSTTPTLPESSPPSTTPRPTGSSFPALQPHINDAPEWFYCMQTATLNY